MIDLFDAGKDYYAVLGVSQVSELSVIKTAFRKLAREFHPDVSSHPLAKSRFQEISEAYDVLSRYRDAYDDAVKALQEAASIAAKRAQQRGYTEDVRTSSSQRARTQTHSSTHSKASFGHWSPDSISGRDRNMVYPLTLKYAFKLLMEGYFLVPSLNTKLPFDSSALNGKTYRFPGKGFPGLFGGKAGDYVVSFKLTHHAPFKIRGGDLYMLLKVPRKIWDTGGEMYFDAPSGLFKVKIPKMVKIGSYIRFSNKGLPKDRHQAGGHLYAKVTVE